MRYLFVFLFSLPSLSDADCPYQVSSNGEAYCLDIEWKQGEVKTRGEFEGTDIESPYLVPQEEIPQRWIYSKAEIITWKKSDSSQAPVEVPNFEIFPYMHMQNGHHHSTGYEFAYDSMNQRYVLSQVKFQSMPGCWSLRWTTSPENMHSPENMQEISLHLMNVTNFTNLDPEQRDDQIEFCQNIDEDFDPVHDHIHGHDH